MAYQPYQPYTSSPQPVTPNLSVPSMGDDGVWGWLKSHLGDLGSFFKDHAGDILKTGGDAAGAYLDYDAKQKALAQQKEQFEKMYGLSQGNQAMTAANQLNRAPVWDRASYLAQNYTPPMPFQPRDITRGGIGALRGQPTGGAAAQLAANAQASNNYKPGAGGIDTSTLRMILQRFGAGPNAATPPGSTPGTPGATPGTTDPRQAAQNAAALASQFAGASTGTPNYQGQANPYGFPLPEHPTLDQVYAAWDQTHPGQPRPSPTSGDLMNFWNEYRRQHSGGG